MYRSESIEIDNMTFGKYRLREIFISVKNINFCYYFWKNICIILLHYSRCSHVARNVNNFSNYYFPAKTGRREDYSFISSLNDIGYYSSEVSTLASVNSIYFYPRNSRARENVVAITGVSVEENDSSAKTGWVTRSIEGKRSRRIFSPTICTLRAKIAQQSPSCARSSATFHPPAVRRLTVRGRPAPPLPLPLLPLLRCSPAPPLEIFPSFS